MKLALVAALVSVFAIQQPSSRSDLERTFVRVYSSGTPGLIAPVVVRNPMPAYNPGALRQKISGDIELELTIGADGRVRDALVKKGVDSQFGLDDASVAAAANWSFEPGRLNGQPVAVRTTVTIAMRLR